METIIRPVPFNFPDQDGFGIYHHDDVPGNSFNLSLLPQDHPFGPQAAGLYFLGIHIADNDAISEFGLIFPDGDWETVHGPNNVGGNAPLIGWDEGVNNIDDGTGAYRIDLTGAEFVPASVPGDVDGNEVVDLLDYAAIRDNFNTGITREEGNLDRRGVTDLVDFQIWRTAFEQGAAPASVPEPSGLALFVMAIGLAIGSRRSSRTNN